MGKNNKTNKRKLKACCSGGICPACDCCICICTKDLKRTLTPEARRLLINAFTKA